jgi:hypothetical protein
LTIQGKKNRGGSSVGAVEECTIFQHALVGVTVTKKITMTNGSRLQTAINERTSEIITVTKGSTK